MSSDSQGLDTVIFIYLSISNICVYILFKTPWINLLEYIMYIMFFTLSFCIMFFFSNIVNHVNENQPIVACVISKLRTQADPYNL